MMKRPLIALLLAAPLAVSLPAFAHEGGEPHEHSHEAGEGAGDAREIAAAAAAMRDAATEFIAALDDSQKKLALLDFGSEERENWNFVPMERAGVSLARLTPEQRELGRKLVESALSEKGLLKVTTIMSLESVLAEMENNPRMRDPEKYFTCIFGTPGVDQNWGWRFEGHHISLSFTIVGNQAISAAPAFLGSNPGEVRSGPKQGTRPLAEEEDLARALAVVLQQAGKPVVFDEKPPNEILTGSERKARQLEPVGVLASDMTEAQRAGLRKLLEIYAGRYRTEIAAREMAQIDAEFEEIRFGWAGGMNAGDAYYYRVQGSRFLVEAANVQNNANHVHTVWRDLEGDFGRDVLGIHQQEHDHGHPHE